MSEKLTVFVVGAGASKEYGLPTGAELKTQIHAICDIPQVGLTNTRPDPEDDWLLSIIKEMILFDGIRSQDAGNLPNKIAAKARLINKYVNDAWFIRDNILLSPSIDNFIHTHRENPRIVKLGKALTRKLIAEAERKSSLYVDDASLQLQLPVNEIENTWLFALINCLLEAGDFDEFLDRLARVLFVVFNYDRCLEQFFKYYVVSYFRLGPKDKNRLSAALKIWHPYGSLSEANPFSSVEAFIRKAKSEVPFGQTDNDIGYLLWDPIKMFTETEGFEGLRREYRDAVIDSIEKCDQVVFLGFGYHKQNLRILSSYDATNDCDVWGTCLGLPKYETDSVQENLSQIFCGGSKDRVRLINASASDLVAEIGKLL
ncbi:hypothetical protein [Ruegeria jejuensis]|uniref:hypothetical protein n=1 Tax=Ruegeria jejuensis TaxID=3233338 RepID=UPI00355B32F7